MTDFERICEYIEQNCAAAVELETLLTRIPALAPESGGDGESEKCAALEQWLCAHGIAQLERFDAPDPRVKGGLRPNLVATVEGKTAKNLWIMSHLDVVPAGERALWSSEPFDVVQKDGKLYGRGVEDDQQGIVCSVMAALALKACGVTPEYTVKLLFVADEEVGSAYGIRFLLEKHALFAADDLIIVPDGGDPKGETLEIAEKNLLWLRFHVAGKQSHGSRPDCGANACLAASDLTVRLHGLRKVFGKRDKLFEPDCSTFEPTKREQNVESVNIIPGDDVFYFDCRVLPCYKLSQVLEEVDKCCRETEAAFGVKVEYTVPQQGESPATPESCEVVAVLAEAVRRVLKINPRTVGIGGGTVAACLRSAGYNAVVWSKQDETMHQPDEYCLVQNLVEESQVLASAMLANR